MTRMRLKMNLFPWELFMFRLVNPDTSPSPISRPTMGWMLMAAALVLAPTAGVSSSSAQAAGCLEGALVGGTAGHLAGDHGALGAGTGCVVGHHEANKHSRQQQTQSAAPGQQRWEWHLALTEATFLTSTMTDGTGHAAAPG
jgi:hypothetical protein